MIFMAMNSMGSAWNTALRPRSAADDQMTVPAPSPSATLKPSMRDCATAVRAVMRKDGPGDMTARSWTRPIDTSGRKSEVANCSPELEYGFCHAERERIRDHGMADGHLLQVRQRLHKCGKIIAGEIMPGIEAEACCFRRLARCDNFVEFAIEKRCVESAAIGPGIDFDAVGANVLCQTPEPPDRDRRTATRASRPCAAAR